MLPQSTGRARKKDTQIGKSSQPLHRSRLSGARTEPVVYMLVDVRKAYFYNLARRKEFIELPEEAGTDKSKSWTFTQMHVWLPRRWSELGIRDLPSHDCNWLRAAWSITVHQPSSGDANP